MMLLRRRHRPPALDPEWPRGTGRPRILVEANDPVNGWAYERILREDGYEVAVCPGPRDSGVACPVLEGRHCPLVENADGILFALPLVDPVQRSLLDAHERHARRLCVETSLLPPSEETPLLEGQVTLDRLASRYDILGAVRRMLGRP